MILILCSAAIWLMIGIASTGTCVLPVFQFAKISLLIKQRSIISFFTLSYLPYGMADVNFRNLFITFELYNYIGNAKIQTISENPNFLFLNLSIIFLIILIEFLCY